MSGNYNFFNLLTIALCIPLLDDAALGETKAPSTPEEEEEEVRWSLMDRIDARGPLGLVYDHLTRKTSVVAYLFCMAFTVISVCVMFEFDQNTGDLALLVTRRSLQRTVDAYLPMGVALYGVGLIIAGLYDIMTALMESKRGLVSFALIVGHRALVFVLVTCTFTAGLVPAIEPLSPKSAQKMWPVVKRAYESSAQFHITGAYGLFRRMAGVGDPEGGASWCKDQSSRSREALMARNGTPIISLMASLVILVSVRLGWPPTSHDLIGRCGLRRLIRTTRFGL